MFRTNAYTWPALAALTGVTGYAVLQGAGAALVGVLLLLLLVAQSITPRQNLALLAPLGLLILGFSLEAAALVAVRFGMAHAFEGTESWLRKYVHAIPPLLVFAALVPVTAIMTSGVFVVAQSANRERVLRAFVLWLPVFVAACVSWWVVSPAVDIAAVVAGIVGVLWVTACLVKMPKAPPALLAALVLVGTVGWPMGTALAQTTVDEGTDVVFVLEAESTRRPNGWRADVVSSADLEKFTVDVFVDGRLTFSELEPEEIEITFEPAPYDRTITVAVRTHGTVTNCQTTSGAVQLQNTEGLYLTGAFNENEPLEVATWEVVGGTPADVANLAAFGTSETKARQFRVVATNSELTLNTKDSKELLTGFEIERPEPGSLFVVERQMELDRAGGSVFISETEFGGSVGAVQLDGTIIGTPLSGTTGGFSVRVNDLAVASGLIDTQGLGTFSVVVPEADWPRDATLDVQLTFDVDESACNERRTFDGQVTLTATPVTGSTNELSVSDFPARLLDGPAKLYAVDVSDYEVAVVASALQATSARPLKFVDTNRSMDADIVIVPGVGTVSVSGGRLIFGVNNDLVSELQEERFWAFTTDSVMRQVELVQPELEATLDDRMPVEQEPSNAVEPVAQDAPLTLEPGANQAPDFPGRELAVLGLTLVAVERFEAVVVELKSRSVRLEAISRSLCQASNVDFDDVWWVDRPDRAAVTSGVPAEAMATAVAKEFDVTLFDGRPVTIPKNTDFPTALRRGSLVVHDGQIPIELCDGAPQTRHSAEIVTYLSMRRLVEEQFGTVFTSDSVDGLYLKSPEHSAKYVLSKAQFRGLVVAVVAGLFWVWIAPMSAAQTAVGGINLFLFAAVAFKLVAVVAGIDGAKPRPTLETLEDYPFYTILAPVFKEPEVVQGLARNLGAMNYPADRFEILLLVEEVDDVTLGALKNVPGNLLPVIVPASDPQTKPKACNWALHIARGEYLVIYDAEDNPDKDQLRVALAEFTDPGNEDVLVTQGALDYWNDEQNPITRMFALEYAFWFTYMLPGLSRLKVPIPLGGTSNHFRAGPLRELGGWDGYNVTEDADLGIRAAAEGWRVTIIPSTTKEEANSQAWGFVRQRSRWLKGYQVTALVRLRHPVELLRTVGVRGFFSFVFLIVGTPATFLITPVLYVLFAVSRVADPVVLQPLFDGWWGVLAAVNLFVVNAVVIWMNLLACVQNRSKFGVVGLPQPDLLAPPQRCGVYGDVGTVEQPVDVAENESRPCRHRRDGLRGLASSGWAKTQQRAKAIEKRN